jgi:hypothetical protein
LRSPHFHYAPPGTGASLGTRPFAAAGVRVAGSIVLGSVSASTLRLGAVLLATALLASCSTVDRIRGTKEGATDDVSAAKMRSDDPLARPVQVAWVSVRAKYCGFVFDPAKLRTDYLAFEQRTGASEADMKKIVHAYDYTLQSVWDSIKGDPDYCDKARTDAIRTALNRYLAGDYSPSSRIAQ